MYRRNPAGEILPPLTTHHKASVQNHIPEILLAWEALYTLHQVLVTVPVPRHELPNKRDRPEAPPLVQGVQHRVPIDLAELEHGQHAAGLQDAVGLAERGGYVAEVADAEGYRVQVHAGGRDAGGGEVLGVGLEEAQGGLLARGEGEGPLPAHGEHVRVDVRDGHAHVGVVVPEVRVGEVPEGDVARAAGYVEDVLRGRGVSGRGDVEARVQGGDVVISESGEGISTVDACFGTGQEGCWDGGGGLEAYFHTRCQPRDIRSFMRSYVSATLLKTPATRCVFSASVTVSKPKCVSRSAVGVSFLEVAPASRVACVVENGRERDIIAVDARVGCR